MADRPGPEIYSIAAHRGFADALVAGLVPRYREDGFGLARLTLLLPSARAQRIVTEAFIRHSGANGEAGLLMPRMAVVGDLDLDERLANLFDPLDGIDIPPAVDPMRRLFALTGLIAEDEETQGRVPPKGAALIRLAREMAATMDRLLIEEISPADLMDPAVVSLDKDLAAHWQESLRSFARVQARWNARLAEWAAIDTATRRNLLFDAAARRWRSNPPNTPLIAAGVTSAAPALARLLRVVSELPQGAVILPDLDLSMSGDVWEELGRAGATPEPGAEPFARGDAVTHPQYHLKLLLNRMGVAREEVRPWHRRGEAAAPPERSHAISALFLPPKASRSWADLPADKRRLAGLRIMRSANPEDEAQAVALLVREALETPAKRVAVVTPDRTLARRIVAHCARWGIEADDSAGRPLCDTAAGRLLLLLAEIMASGPAPVTLTALLMHPLVGEEDKRGEWLANTRALERSLRGPRPREGLAPLRAIIARLEQSQPGLGVWWERVEADLAPLLETDESFAFDEALTVLANAAEAFAGDRAWAREDGRALARLIEDLRLHAGEAGTRLAREEIDVVLRDVMEQVAVRPPWGGHSRVAVYGLLESRMSRADLVICAGLNEGVWPPRGSVDALLAPPVLRQLGVPGGDFRIGLAAHDLAGALGAPEIVLSRAERDAGGPTIPSRFLLRVEALLGDMAERHRETRAVELARSLTIAEPSPPYPQPMPKPSAEQRDVDISATALDRLLGDPYQFYAGKILALPQLDPVDAEPSAAWQGTLVHDILQRWHEACRSDPDSAIEPIMAAVMEEQNINPLLAALWQPRLAAALEWIVGEVRQSDRAVLAVEAKGEMDFDGVHIHGRADRIDRLRDGGLAIVDYKTGGPPSPTQVKKGYALQLGVLGLIAEASGFKALDGAAEAFEYWSLGSSDKSATGFGYRETPLDRRTGPTSEEFLPETRIFLKKAIERYIKGDDPFTARENPDYPAYDTYDQLMRLAEWLPRLAEDDTP
ncbi:double-strand break repair protein AddB [Porphyrobacter algicida]|uniref:Double-strand break repair protein AddB n=1 Tax=Qipengyuania algicida TaxID=1836209 RepID=A0A845AK49_9SPHN|nr:double-strand break repair protein AddB [Qipengyuania algicida]